MQRSSQQAAAMQHGCRNARRVNWVTADSYDAGNCKAWAVSARVSTARTRRALVFPSQKVAIDGYCYRVLLGSMSPCSC